METARMDNVLDRLDTAIKEYLTSIDTDALDGTDHRRLSEILAFTTNLEHAGDIVEKSLMPLGNACSHMQRIQPPLIKLARHATGVIGVIGGAVSPGCAGGREVSQRRDTLGPVAGACLP
jgi:hypothetical protein